MPIARLESPAGQQDHLVRRLAREEHIPEHEARCAYQRELDRLGRDARVRTYLPVLAARHAREALRRQHG